MMYELIPRYGSRKSFYGKAHTFMDGDKLKLYSYNTLVVEKDMSNGKVVYRYFGHYSSTTTSHQKEFFRQLGLSDNEIKKLFKEGELVYE